MPHINMGLGNPEPGVDLFNQMIFGGVDDADLPTNVEDPFISYEEDAREYETFVSESDRAYAGLMRKITQLHREQVMSRSIAMECASIMPNFLKKRRIESFTMTPSRTNYEYAVETASWAVWGLVAAGVAALVALAWKLYRVITGTTSSDTSSPSSGNKGGSMTEAEADKAANNAEASSQQRIEKREVRSKTFGEVATQLNEILSHQDGVVKITATNIGEEPFKAIDNQYTKEEGIRLDYAFLNALLLATYNKEGTHEYNLIHGLQGNNAMRIIFHVPQLANETQQTIGDINEMFKTVFAELDEIFKITMSVDNANMVDLENTQAKTAEIVQRVRNVVEPDPTGGGPNKSRLMMAIDRLSAALQFKGEMPTDKTPMDLQKILDTVGKQDGAYITLFKLLEDTIYTGPECLTRKISGLITRLEAMEKVMQNRIDGEDKPDRDMVTEKGKENKNRDAIAKNVKANVGVVRSTLQQTQAMLKAIKPFTTEVIELDKLIGRVLVDLLKTMDKIYKDNGKQTNKFVELANKIANSLGYGNKMFS